MKPEAVSGYRKVRTKRGATFSLPAAVERACLALSEFLTIAKNLKSRKILCIATSAVRDAPNRKEFINRVKRELNLKVKVIDGRKEAYLGGIAAANLLPITDAVSIDIGGGSTDLALVRDKKVVAVHSMKLGTVRLKELFFDEILDTLPENFKSGIAVGIGGTVSLQVRCGA